MKRHIMNQYRKSQLGLMLVAIIWGSGFVASSIALEYFSPIHILVLRFSIAFLLMLVFFHKGLKQIKRSTIWKGVTLGIFLYFAFYFQTVGLVYTTPSKNAFLTAVNVVLVPFLSALFFKNKLQPKALIGAFVTLFGIAFMSLEGFGVINIGDLLTLICALMFALQILFTDRYVAEEDVFNLTTIQMGSASLCAFIGMFFESTPFNFSNVRGNLAILYLGIISTMLAFMLQTYSQQYTGETETAIILSTESIFGMLFSAMILREIITLRMLIGAALIFAGVIIVQIKPKEAVPKEVTQRE